MFKRNFVISLAFILVKTTSYAIGYSSDRLFYIERSRDADIVVYNIDWLPDGTIHPDKPIRAVWIKHTQGGKEEGLTRLQQQFGYGLKIDEYDSDKGWYPFEFVSMSGRKFYLTPTPDQQNYHVIFFEKGEPVKLEKLFIQFSGGTYLTPRIGFVRIHGRYLNDSKPYTEDVEP